MTIMNENQKKLLQEIKEPIFNLRRMNKIVELLEMIVQDNTIEKSAKDDFIKKIIDNEQEGERGGGGKGGTGGTGGIGGSGKPGTIGKPGEKGSSGGKGGPGGEGGSGGNA